MAIIPSNNSTGDTIPTDDLLGVTQANSIAHCYKRESKRLSLFNQHFRNHQYRNFGCNEPGISIS